MPIPQEQQAVIDEWVEKKLEEDRKIRREQRRYEIARDCYAAMLVGGNSDGELFELRVQVGLPEGADQGRILAEHAVLYADELLARLEQGEA